MKKTYERKERLLRPPRRPVGLRQTLSELGYCSICRQPNARPYYVGRDVARFFGERVKVVLCPRCLSDYQPLFRLLHKYHRYQRLITKELTDG